MLIESTSRHLFYSVSCLTFLGEFLEGGSVVLVESTSNTRMSSATKAKSLEETPTWAVAVVCFVLVGISIVIEHLIHVVEKVCTCLL